jgi:hypothetical protein
MDPFQLFILLLFFLLPAISKLLERRRRAQMPEEEYREEEHYYEAPGHVRQPTPDRPRAERPRPIRPAHEDDEDEALADALRQIREALGQPGVAADPAPRQQQAQAPPPPPTAAPEPYVPPPPPPRPEPKRPVPPPVVAIRAVPEIRQERVPSLSREIAVPLMRTPERSTEASRLLGNLHDPEEAKRAFLLHEVLSPPPSLRGRR